MLQFSEGIDYRSRQTVLFTCCSTSSVLVRVVEIKLPGMGWPKLPSFFRKAVLGPFSTASPRDSRYAAHRRIFWGAFSAVTNGGIGTGSCVEMSPIFTPGGFIIAS
ncbi:MAG TPA: hypothetical protein VN879_00550 [Candidatus Acidoferrales bacterium]|nr:hypothetical protein [Candidatus Acidoferrales bacterium]